MIHNARTKALLAVWLTLLLLLCSSGGCARARCPSDPACGGSCLFRCFCGPKRARPECVVDPICYGYEATCWEPWPEQCAGCPMDQMQLETQIDVAGDDVGVNGTAGPHPAEVPEESISLPPGAADLEPVPPPDPDADDGQDDGANEMDSPPDEGREKAEPFPFREEEPRSGGNDADVPPAANDGEPPKDRDRSPEPSPPSDSQTGAGTRSLLRFVVFSTPEPAASNTPVSTSRSDQDEVGKPTQRGPKELEHRHDTLASRPSGQLPPRDEPRALLILEALRTSFSPPAPRRLPLEARSTRAPGS